MNSNTELAIDQMVVVWLPCSSKGVNIIERKKKEKEKEKNIEDKKFFE